MSDRKSQEIEQRLQAEVRALADAELSPEIAHRLAGMRRQAVEIVAQQNRPQRRFDFGWPAWGVLAAGAAAVVLAAGVLLNGSAQPFPLLDEQEFAAAQEIELLEELEFLAWLEEEHDGAG